MPYKADFTPQFADEQMDYKWQPERYGWIVSLIIRVIEKGLFYTDYVYYT